MLLFKVATNSTGGKNQENPSHDGDCSEEPCTLAPMSYQVEKPHGILKKNVFWFLLVPFF